MSSTTTQREPELAGQTVVLIGGSAGIGLETARRARAEGAEVVLTGRHPDRLKQAAGEVGARSTAAFDATDAAAVAGFFQDLPAPIDHVLITAGGPHYGAAARDGRRPGTRGAQRPRGAGTRGRAQRRPQDEARRHAAAHGRHRRPAHRSRRSGSSPPPPPRCPRSRRPSRLSSRPFASTSSPPASSTPRCRRRCSETSSRTAGTSCGRRSRSAASSVPPTSPRSPSTS